MDKRKVVAAYWRGFISIKEGAQILGIDVKQMSGLVHDPYLRPAVSERKKLFVHR